MDMLRSEQIAQAGLSDWRKLAQGLHARYRVDDFGGAARFVAAIAEAGDAVGHRPRVSVRGGCVDLEVVSSDAVFRDDDGAEYVVEWVTQQDVELARSITQVAAEHGLAADPSAVSEVELGLGDPADGDRGQRLHVEIYVPPETVAARVADAVAAGGTVVDDSRAPSLTVIADQDGNTAVVCADVAAAPRA